MKRKCQAVTRKCVLKPSIRDEEASIETKPKGVKASKAPKDPKVKAPQIEKSVAASKLAPKAVRRSKNLEKSNVKEKSPAKPKSGKAAPSACTTDNRTVPQPIVRETPAPNPLKVDSTAALQAMLPSPMKDRLQNPDTAPSTRKVTRRRGISVSPVLDTPIRRGTRDSIIEMRTPVPPKTCRGSELPREKVGCPLPTKEAVFKAPVNVQKARARNEQTVPPERNIREILSPAPPQPTASRASRLLDIGRIPSRKSSDLMPPPKASNVHKVVRPPTNLEDQKPAKVCRVDAPIQEALTSSKPTHDAPQEELTFPKAGKAWKETIEKIIVKMLDSIEELKRDRTALLEDAAYKASKQEQFQKEILEKVQKMVTDIEDMKERSSLDSAEVRELAVQVGEHGVQVNDLCRWRLRLRCQQKAEGRTPERPKARREVPCFPEIPTPASSSVVVGPNNLTASLQVSPCLPAENDTLFPHGTLAFSPSHQHDASFATPKSEASRSLMSRSPLLLSVPERRHMDARSSMMHLSPQDIPAMDMVKAGRRVEVLRRIRDAREESARKEGLTKLGNPPTL